MIILKKVDIVKNKINEWIMYLYNNNNNNSSLTYQWDGERTRSL